MTITIKNEQTLVIGSITKNKLKKYRSNLINELENMPLHKGIEIWLKNLHPETRKNYSYYISNLMTKGIIISPTVGHFNCIPHEQLIDHIKSLDCWSEATRQLMAACYISFTAYLYRLSQGWFRKAIPSLLPSNKTFFQVTDKCVTEALTLHEWHKFIECLKIVNYRDSLVAKSMLQGGKRISEVLNTKIDQIDFDKNVINYYQSKTGGTIKKIPISYPIEFINELKIYIDKTKNLRSDTDYIFITNKGKKVHRTHFNITFLAASNRARIKRVTPHVLRATWITIAKKEGIPDSEIMKVTGHSSSKMIYFYDKNEIEDNYSKKMVLI